MKNIVVFGGGHGQSTILSGIKSVEDVALSAVVTVADDGGSTGRLRTLYEIPAMGDIRNVLYALRSEDSLMSSLLNYRFAGEEELDVEGHSLGNLILTALTQMYGSFDKGIELLSEELGVKGKVIPSSLEVISLYARMSGGTIVKGEANIPSFNHHIEKVFYDHEVEAYAPAVKAVEEADLIIYGIGSLYTSILPNIIIPGIRNALAQSKATKIYFANCMTQNNETFDFDLRDHIDALEAHGAPVDLVVKHRDEIPPEILKRYAAEHSTEVVIRKEVRQPVLSFDLLDFSKGLVRHDPQKIANVLRDLLRREDVLHR
ncbi:MAG: uridine diphosphate-N-acetylglucosamine-binding protein YvcK [Erysipelotrichaceae bacterium]|nr:uridine diphosphate-N-acetylglucosamine-binding protein YvcK [Erysipelotrichaceae bacterium]